MAMSWIVITNILFEMLVMFLTTYYYSSSLIPRPHPSVKGIEF